MTTAALLNAPPTVLLRADDEEDGTTGQPVLMARAAGTGDALLPGRLAILTNAPVGATGLPMGHETAAGVAVLDRVVSYWSVIFFGALLQFFGRHR